MVWEWGAPLLLPTLGWRGPQELQPQKGVWRWSQELQPQDGEWRGPQELQQQKGVWGWSQELQPQGGEWRGGGGGQWLVLLGGEQLGVDHAPSVRGRGGGAGALVAG